MNRALFLITALFFTLPAFAATQAEEPVQPPAPQVCPATPEPLLTAQVQADCCKGRKGVCGCRAGKIVCCDNSVSPNCACHGDEPGTVH